MRSRGTPSEAGQRRPPDPGGVDGGPSSPAILEREAELAALDEAIAAAVAGDGRAVLLEGQAGVGKTTLLDEAVRRARARGFGVLRARGDALERDFPWGMAAQLFGPTLGPGTAEGLSGTAALARPVFDVTAGAGRSALDAHPILHGLHWLTVDLTDRTPHLVVVDDAHWSDPETLRFLCYLIRRLEGVRASVLLATRPGETADAQAADYLTRTAADPATRVLAVEALGDDSIRRIVRSALPTATDAFCSAVAAAVAGNPFLCHEVVGSVRAEGLAPSDASAARLRDLRAPGIRSSILVRLGMLGHAAAELAAAVAVLGTGCASSWARDLAGLDDEAAAAAVDVLVAAGILVVDDVVDFAHPIVREAVYLDIGPARRARAHLEAARVLAGVGAPAPEIAQHLLAGDRCVEPWAADALRDAAAAATARRAPERAVTLLRAALDASPSRRVEDLLTLGRLEVAVGDVAAMSRYDEVLALRPAATCDPTIALALGQGLYAAGRFVEAGDVFARSVASLAAGEVEPGVEAGLRAGLDMARMLSAVGGRPWAAPPPAEDPPASPQQADRIAAALAAGRHALGVGVPDAERNRERAAALATLALDGDGLPDQAGALALEPVALALTFADDLERAEAVLDTVLRRSGGEGDAAAYASLVPIRALVRYCRGDLAGATADAEDAIRLATEVPLAFQKAVAAARCVLATASLARGDLDSARQAVAVEDADARWTGSPLYGWYLDGLGHVRLATGDAEGALTAFRDAGRWFSAAGGPGAYWSWRSAAALAARAAGAEAEALALADEELRLARSFGAPRALAIALRRRARLHRSEEAAVALLQESVAVLDGSPATLERARVQVDLGAALRRQGRRRDSRPVLRAGMDAARACGARPLVERAAAELEASGARRPDLALTGPEALTPAERRVVRLATEGRTNREIAESLFVTRKTVEVHLSSAYRKLSITSRAELATALG